MRHAVGVSTEVAAVLFLMTHFRNEPDPRQVETAEGSETGTLNEPLIVQ